jgi:hypothetical protein
VTETAEDTRVVSLVTSLKRVGSFKPVRTEENIEKIFTITDFRLVIGPDISIIRSRKIITTHFIAIYME